jgi:ribonucleoside-diphosphate reductase alpha chain
MTSYEPTGDLPRRRTGVTYSVEVAGADMFVTANRFADGQLREVFAKWGKAGSTACGLMEAFSIALSLAVQYGAPLHVIIARLKDQRFEPSGFTDDPDIPHVSSVMDWLAQRLALDFFAPHQRADLGIYGTDEEARQLSESTASG